MNMSPSKLILVLFLILVLLSVIATYYNFIVKKNFYIDETISEEI